MKLKLFAFATAFILVSPLAIAQEAGSTAWTGEGAFNAGLTTGNTETTDLGLGLKLAREAGLWTTNLEASADFGETDGVQTRNRFFLGGQLDRVLSEKLYAFGRLSYEQDEFSGFDSRIFLGGGLGYVAIDSESTKWTLEGGPGYRIDELAAEFNGGLLVTPATTEESFAVRGASNFSHALNDKVNFTNDTTVTWADVSTQITNSAAITAQLTDRISGRVSFDVRHDTNPPLGFEETDTATKVGIVYAFGG